MSRCHGSMLDPLSAARYRGPMSVGSTASLGRKVIQWGFLGLALCTFIGYGSVLLGPRIQSNSPEEVQLNNLEATQKFQRLDESWQSQWNLAAMERSPWKAQSAKEDVLQVDPNKGLVLVNLWATWCEPCKAEFPSMVKLAREQPGVTLVFVSYDNNWEAQLRFFNQHFGGVPRGVVLLRDPAGKGQGTQPPDTLWQGLGATAVPETFIVRNGHVVSKVIGGLNWNHPEVRQYLLALQSRTPLVGCQATPRPSAPGAWLLFVLLMGLVFIRRRMCVSGRG